MAWWFLGAGLLFATAAGALAGLRHARETSRCIHDVRLADDCPDCPGHSDDPAFCPPCGGPCMDDPAGFADDWRLP